MKIDKIVVSVEETLGSEFRLVEIKENYAYDNDNKKTNKVTSISFICVVPRLSYEKIAIKVEKPSISFERWSEALNSEDYPEIPVEFENMQIKLWQDYRNKNQIELSVTADDVNCIES